MKRVCATGVKRLIVSRGIDTYDSIMTHVVFADGAHASFENSWIAPETMPMLVRFAPPAPGGGAIGKQPGL